MFDDTKDKLSSWKYKFCTSIAGRPADFHTDFSEDAAGDSAPSPGLEVDSTKGADAVVKVLYEGKHSQPGFYDWCDTPPRQVSKKVAIKNDRVAIKVYKIIDKEKEGQNGRYTLKFHQIELQNPTLIEALKDIVSKEDVYLDPSEVARFRAPFRPLWFCYDEIRGLCKTADENSVLRQQLSLLLRVMAELFHGVKTRLHSLEAAHLIAFNLAWAFYPKGTVLYLPGTDCERLLKVDNSGYMEKDGRKNFVLDCQEIVFDGEKYVWQDVQLTESCYAGNKPLTESKFYPLSYHEDPEGVKQRIKARGKRALSFQGLHYAEYKGLGFLEEEEKFEKHNVEGRILIDTFGYAKHHLGLSRKGGAQDKATLRNQITRIKVQSKNVKQKLEIGDTSCLRSNPMFYIDHRGEAIPIDPATGEPPSVVKQDTEDDESYITRLTDAEMEQNTREMLARQDDLVFVSPMLRGFALKNKLWLNFYVDDVQPITWNDTAYSHLVYPEEQKDLVLSFVSNHSRTNKGMDDVILGKGQGLIFLLSGPPGTGKTLTAEAVADKTRRPLFYLQAEDLGIVATSLGANLKKCFEMATDWDAVILLDEADVFMAERHPNDIARNELVSIFLRELEYFRGIIFLTTNLFETIDAAFRSRVNIHLLFNPLPPSSRQILWKKFLDRLSMAQGPPAAALSSEEDSEDTSSGDSAVVLSARKGKARHVPVHISDEDIKELGDYNLNGREIKNAIKTVQSWCETKGYDITLARLESAIKVTAPQARRGGVREPGQVDELYD